MIVEYNIENIEGILIHWKGNYCSILKKVKLKIIKFLKIIMLGEQEHSVQSADRTSAISASLTLRKYLYTQNWKVAITESTPEDK